MTDRPRAAQLDLFASDPLDPVPDTLSQLRWPDPGRMPLNRAAGPTVGSVVRGDLLASRQPLLITGYASLDQLVDLASSWQHQSSDDAPPVADRDRQLRILLGSEPFPSTRQDHRATRHSFADEVARHWADRGFSIRLSAKLITAIEAARHGHIAVRFMPGRTRLHAKLYLGDDAATVGSSNFTDAGLHHQFEANVRFTRHLDRNRYLDARQVADNFWVAGQDWTDEFVALLERLLQVVDWREALARACADILEGDWARAHLARLGTDQSGLWPSQQVGIAQALWIVDQVGSVLVADATGSGKTRMGAHLVRAVRDRLFATGRTRHDLAVLVCPPAVEPTWQREAVACGLSINTVSHGKLSTHHGSDDRPELASVRRAQLLAVDEAHNFLSPASRRTQQVRANVADHVLLFTATPINRGAADLLEIVALLGPDNLEDDTHRILEHLSRSRGRRSVMTPAEEQRVRQEIQRFTLRRTKRQLNQMVAQEPDAYRHPQTDRVCRFPDHQPRDYPTGETDADAQLADAIRGQAAGLHGVTRLTDSLQVPRTLQRVFTPQRWVQFRVRSAAGLASHHVLAALRSSRAALHEHLWGTDAAIDNFGLPGFKAKPTGNILEVAQRLRSGGPPTVPDDADAPAWLTDPDEWVKACDDDLARYGRIAELLDQISDAREQTKAGLLADLADRHPRVLAFDRHLVTLSVMQQYLHDRATTLVATGQSRTRTALERAFAPDAEVTDTIIALCSDAMNEGLNLQGASAMVHLDLPTTLRVAEQRVGRVDRMDSRHDQIEAWWPRDGQAFATRANERLLQRVEESETYLGSNLPLPDLGQGSRDQIITVDTVLQEIEEAQREPVDQLTDALEPVRRLVEGDSALLTEAAYRQLRGGSGWVLARVAPLASDAPWAFVSVTSGTYGVPRWMFIDPSTCITDLAGVADQLRSWLADDPPRQELDDHAVGHLGRLVEVGAAEERRLLPRRIQRALGQVHGVAEATARSCRIGGDDASATRWQTIAELVEPLPDATHLADPVAVGEAWLELIGGRLEEFRRSQRRRRYVLIDDLTTSLVEDPPAIAEVEDAMRDVRPIAPFADRITACILGVPPA